MKRIFAGAANAFIAFALFAGFMATTLLVLSIFNIGSVSYGDQDVFVTISVFGIFFALFFIASDSRRKKRETLESISQTLDGDLRAVVRAKELFTSSEKHYRAAIFSQVLSFAILILVAVFVALAGMAISRETVEFQTASQLRAQIAILEAEKANFEELDAGFRRWRERVGNDLSSPENLSIENAFRALVDIASTRNQGQLDQFRTDLANALRKQLDAEVDFFSPTYRMFSSIVIRISVVAVAIYLVVILNKAYKMNIKLSSYYRSRFLSMIRGDSNLKEFSAYTKLTNPSVDFDDDIRHPIEHIVESIKEMSATLGMDGAQKRKSGKIHETESATKTNGT